MDKYLQKQVVFFGGKGGVGKTTVSSAFALAVSHRGKRTLLVSTDPAHNLQDIFGRSIGNRKPSRLETNLWVMEIDPHAESHRYIDRVKENIRKTVNSQMMQEIDRQIDIAQVSPGAEEAAMFDRMVEIIQWSGKEYDMIVFDTAPTGHTLRLMSLPELMGAWIDGMLQRRKTVTKMRETLLEEANPQEDPIYKILAERKMKFAGAREILLDPRKTAFSFVLIPERLPISETARALPVLDKYKIPVDTLVVNRVLPETADGSFLQRRREQESKYLNEIEDRFRKYKRVRIPMLDRDVSSIETLNEIGVHLFDPERK